MNVSIVTFIKWTTLVLAWLLLSPLFYWLAGKWGMISKKYRIWFTILSPNIIILFLLLLLQIILFVAYMIMLYNSRDMVPIYEDTERMERITGVVFPEFKLVEVNKGETNFLGDYEDCFVLEMREELPEATYHYLDSIIECGDTHWGKDGDRYWYRNIGGNGEPVPEGENPDIDRFIEINLEKGDRTVNLSWGVW